MKTDREVIEKAISLIEGDGRWCQGEFCRDRRGNPVRLEDPEHQAHSFCLEGALWMAGQSLLGNTTTTGRPQRRTPETYLQINKLCFYIGQLAYLSQSGQLAYLSQSSIINGIGFGLHSYNDDPSTTQEDAILLLKHALEDTDPNGMILDESQQKIYDMLIEQGVLR